MPSLATRLRRAIARRFFVALRRATHRMPSELRTVAKARVLVVAPHIDDEAIPCGGTLALHARVGSTVYDGSVKSQLEKLRKQLVGQA